MGNKLFVAWILVALMALPAMAQIADNARGVGGTGVAFTPDDTQPTNWYDFAASGPIDAPAGLTNVAIIYGGGGTGVTFASAVLFTNDVEFAPDVVLTAVTYTNAATIYGNAAPVAFPDGVSAGIVSNVTDVYSAGGYITVHDTLDASSEEGLFRSMVVDGNLWTHESASTNISSGSSRVINLTGAYPTNALPAVVLQVCSDPGELIQWYVTEITSTTFTYIVRNGAGIITNALAVHWHAKQPTE